jgi:hypothetical protein
VLRDESLLIGCQFQTILMKPPSAGEAVGLGNVQTSTGAINAPFMSTVHTTAATSERSNKVVPISAP